MEYLAQVHRTMKEVEFLIRGNPEAYGLPARSVGTPTPLGPPTQLGPPKGVGPPTHRVGPPAPQPTRPAPSPPPVVHISCWCRAGKHMSVGFGELLAAIFREIRWSVTLTHVSLTNHQHAHRRCHQCTGGVVRQNLEIVMDRWDQLCQGDDMQDR